MKPSSTPSLFLSLLVLGTAPAAEILTVGSSGSGADFTDIQPAVDAALPGDTIRILAGSYTGFTVGKPLTIQGAGSDQCFVETVFVGFPRTVIEVDGLASGTLVISGLEVDPTFSIWLPAITVSDSAGTVVLHDVVLEEPADRKFLHVEGPTDLVLSHFTAHGTTVVPNAGAYFLVSVLEGNAWIIDSSIVNEDETPAWLNNDFGALELSQSDAYIYGTSVDGRDLEPGGLAHWGGDGIWSHASTLFLSRTTVTGGDAAGSYEGGYAARLSGASVATLLPDTSLEGGLGVGGVQDPLLLEGESQVVRAASAAPGLSVTESLLEPGDTLEFSLTGPALAPGRLFVALQSGTPTEYPGLAGALFLPPSLVIDLGNVSLDANGAAQLTATVPDAAGLSGRLAVFQWVAASGPALVLSNPAFASFE